jgi:conjugative transfer pilus assembly protein TraH
MAKRLLIRSKYIFQMLCILSIFSLVFASQSYAGLSSSLSGFLDSASYSSNVTEASASLTQQGGYLQGGSGYIRTPVENLQIANIQLPGINAGCGGIDIFTGGMSFISSEKLTQFGQAVVQNAIPYSVQLALKIWTPTIAENLQWFLDIVEAINNFNMSSCQAAQLGVNAVAGLFEGDDVKSAVCQSYGTQSNMFSDWLASKQGCDDDKAAEVTQKAKEAETPLADLIKANRNIVWFMLMKNDYLHANKQIAEYLMSMTGTVVYGDNVKNDITPWGPLIGDQTSAGIDMMLYGKGTSSSAVTTDESGKTGETDTTISIYECDSNSGEECKKKKIVSLNIDAKDALIPRLSATLANIGKKIKTDQDLQPDEENLVNSTHIPVAKFIENDIRSGLTPPYHEYAEVIAREVLSRFMDRAITQAAYSLQNDPLAKTDEVKAILNNLYMARKELVERVRSQAYDMILARQQMISRSLEIEKSIVGALSAEALSKRKFGN